MFSAFSYLAGCFNREYGPHNETYSTANLQTVAIGIKSSLVSHGCWDLWQQGQTRVVEGPEHRGKAITGGGTGLPLETRDARTDGA